MMKEKFKVGQQVRVRSDLVVGKVYGDDRFMSDMQRLSGQQVTIKNVYDTKYTIKEDEGYWDWTDEMLEPVETFKVEDVVYNKDSKNSKNPLIILRKAWVVCPQNQTSYELFVDERYLTHKKPLEKITKEQLAEMGYEVGEE